MLELSQKAAQKSICYRHDLVEVRKQPIQIKCKSYKWNRNLSWIQRQETSLVLLFLLWDIWHDVQDTRGAPYISFYMLHGWCWKCCWKKRQLSFRIRHFCFSKVDQQKLPNDKNHHIYHGRGSFFLYSYLRFLNFILKFYLFRRRICSTRVYYAGKCWVYTQHME